MSKFYFKYGAHAFSGPESKVSICTIHSCEYLEQELKSNTTKTGIFYFKLAHFLNIREKQLKLINGFKFKYGLETRKTTNARLLRIEFPKPSSK